jgi:hypothetical protein
MSLLGKILLFINLLAAGGLVYLAAQDWGKRQGVSNTVLRYQLLLAGVQVDKPKEKGDEVAVPLAVPNGDGTVTESVSKKVLDAHFSGAAGGQYAGTGTPTDGQVGEVEAAQRKVDELVAGKPDADVLKALCGEVSPQGRFESRLLGTLARTFEERAMIRGWALARGQQRQQEAREAAVAHLKRRFDAVLAAPNPQGFAAEAAELEKLRADLQANPNNPQAAAALQQRTAAGFSFTRDETDRRKGIATLLMLLDPGPAQQKRVMLVCGLRAYVAAVGEQANRVEEMIRRTERAFELDQAAFEDQYETLKRLAGDKDQLVTQQRRVTAGLQAQLADDQAALAKRESQLKGLQDDLAKLQGEVADLLKAQAKVEAELFAVQKQVGETIRGNVQLMDALYRAEQDKTRR